MTLEEYKNKKKKKNNNYLSNLLTRVLITIILIFGVLIMVNLDKDFKKVIEKYLFKTNYNFSSVNKLYNKYFANINTPSTALASKEIDNNICEKYKDGCKKEMKENESIKLLNSGIVVYIGEKEGYGNTIIVQQSNGIDAWYGNVNKVNVKLYDYIEKDKVIATSKDNLYLVFQKDGEFIDYKTVLE